MRQVGKTTILYQLIEDLLAKDIPEKNSLSKELGASRPTVENYIKLLAMANMIYISDLV